MRLAKFLSKGLTKVNKSVLNGGNRENFISDTNLIIPENKKNYPINTDIENIYLLENMILFESLELIQRTAKIGFWSLDLKTNQPTWSKELFALFGFDHTESPPDQHEILRLIHPDDREAYIKLMQESKASKKQYETQIRVLYKNEKYKWFYVVGEPVSTDDEVEIFFGIVMDITEQKELQINLLHTNEKMTQSETLFRQFAEKINDVFWRASPFLDQIIYVSPAYEKIWGRSCEALYKNSMDWFDAIVPEDQEKVRTAFGQAKNGKEIAVEFRITRPDGLQRYIYSRGFPVFGDHGYITAILGIDTDITDFKRASQNLEIQSQITQIIENHIDLKEIIHLVLQKVCLTMQWDFGEVWLMDNKLGVLKNIELWHNISEKDFDLMDAITRSLIMKPGQVFPGQVWQKGAPIWIADLEKIKMVRRLETKTAHLNSALGVPIISHKKIIGVMCFYNSKIEEPDEGLLNIVQLVAAQLGEYFQLKQTEESILLASRRDMITGLLNRNAFEENLNHVIDKSNSSHFAVLVFDIDRFSQVWSSIGNNATDILLQKISERLRNFVIHDFEHSAHLPPNKFVVYLPHVNLEHDILVFAQKIINIFKDPFFINGEDIIVSTHVGIALYPRDGSSGEDVVQNANLALQLASYAGTNNIQFYSRELSESSTKLKLETALRNAIAKKELTLYYQPKANLRTGKISGFEALIRWKHYPNGVLTPSHFLSIAEETGLIIPMTEWIFEEVCKNIKQGEFQVPVAVNLSPQHFKKQYNLVPFVENLLNKYNIEGKNISIEIIESRLLDNIFESLQILNSLRDLGLTIALDDFGTGFSSFNYLLRIPADTIKIDKSFIENIPDDHNSVSIVNAIITLGHSLNKKVVAEGIQSIEQIKFLRSIKCDEAQGYYISPPLPLNEIKNFLAKNKQANVL